MSPSGEREGKAQAQPTRGGHNSHAEIVTRDALPSVGMESAADESAHPGAEETAAHREGRRDRIDDTGPALGVLTLSVAADDLPRDDSARDAGGESDECALSRARFPAVADRER